MEITFHQAREGDFEFLWELHKATMKIYVDETWGWDEEFQKKYFNTQFDPIAIELIIYKNTKIGAIEIRERDRVLYISNFKILPRFRNKGIGTIILKELIKTSDNKQKPMKLQVLKVNPARQLYIRSGFKTFGNTETHFIMERSVG